MRQRSYKLAFLFGLGSALVGGMVAAGYLLPIPGLVRPWPGLPAATLDSALCLIAGGLALLVAARRPSKLATGATSGLGIAVAVCGALAGAERILGVDLGIDARVSGGGLLRRGGVEAAARRR